MYKYSSVLSSESIYTVFIINPINLFQEQWLESSKVFVVLIHQLGFKAHMDY